MPRQYFDEVPKLFISEDTVFHYTSAQTAVEYILFNEELKLSKVMNSKDPFESTCAENLIIQPDPKVLPNGKTEIEQQKFCKVETYMKNLAKESKHLCFCMNHYEKGRLESLNDCGFLKQRMWYQYGNNFSGVCLAFSLKELKKAGNRIYWQNRKYLSYEEQISFGTIQLEDEHLIDDEQERNTKLKEKILDNFNNKNSDFNGECEIRGITFCENYEYLNIGKSIKGIIICADAIENQFLITQLTNYADKKQIELLNLHWRGQYVLWATKEDRKRMNDLMNKIWNDC